MKMGSHASGGRLAHPPAWLFWSALILLGAASASIGAVPTHVYGHDVMLFVAMGWRTLNGQRCHLDYVSGWGPVLPVLAGVGLFLSKHVIEGIGYAISLFGFLVGACSYLLTSGRMSAWPRILVSLYLTLLCVAPFPLGLIPTGLSFAMIYNRMGYGLIGLVLLEAFQTSEGPGRGRSDALGGFSSGFIALTAFCLKASFGFVALGFIFLSLIISNRSKPRIAGLSAGAGAAFLLLLIYLRFHLAPMVRDLTMTAASRRQSFPWHFAATFALLHMGDLLLVVLLGFCVSWALAPSHPWWAAYRFTVLAVAVAGADFLLLLSNQQESGLPLSGVFGLMVLNIAVAHRAPVSDSTHRFETAWRIALACLALLPVVPRIAFDFAGTAWGFAQKRAPMHAASLARFDAPVLSPLLLYDAKPPASNGSVYVNYVNDGLNTLRRMERPGEKVTTLDMANPFPYALGQPPPLGGMSAISYNSSLSASDHPPPSLFFGNADLVMVPKRPANPLTEQGPIYDLYSRSLHDTFTVVAETDWWYVFRRKSPPPAAGAR